MSCVDFSFKNRNFVEYRVIEGADRCYASKTLFNRIKKFNNNVEYFSNRLG